MKTLNIFEIVRTLTSKLAARTPGRPGLYPLKTEDYTLGGELMPFVALELMDSLP